MADKGVVHEAFELLADLRQSEKKFESLYTSQSMQLHMVKDTLEGFNDFEGKPSSDVNFIQVLRKIIEDRKALLEVLKLQSKNIQSIFQVIERVIGDTDPYTEENWTDEDIKQEEPLLWACNRLIEAEETLNKSIKRMEAGE
jgi:hypothetical protein